MKIKMNFNKIKNKEERYYANVFGRLPLTITNGYEMYLWDVTSPGHVHPKIIKSITKQTEKLIHVS